MSRVRTPQTASPVSGLMFSLPSDPLIDRIGLVTHFGKVDTIAANNPPASYQASGNVIPSNHAALLTDLGIRHIRDDSIVSSATIPTAGHVAASLANQVNTYQILQAAGVNIGAIVADPEALYNVVHTLQPNLTNPFEWLEGMNEQTDTYISNPAAWTQYNPPAPVNSWGTLWNGGFWAIGLSVPQGALMLSANNVTGGCTTMSGSNVIQLSNTAGMQVGMFVGDGASGGSFLPVDIGGFGGAYISAITPNTSITLVTLPGGSTPANCTANHTANAVIFWGGTAVGGSWVAAVAHTSSSTNHPDLINVPDNGGSGGTGGFWLPGTGYSGPWVPMWAYHGIGMGLLMQSLRASGAIKSTTRILSPGTSQTAGPDNLLQQKTLTTTANIVLGTPFYGCDHGEVHGYGSGGDQYVHNAAPGIGSGLWDRYTVNPLTTPSNLMAVAYPKGMILGENGYSASDNGSGELGSFANLMVAMVEAYRLGIYRVCIYELIDQWLGANSPNCWPSPIGSDVVGGSWECFGLAAWNNVVLNNTVANDVRKKNGWSYLKNFIAAISDSGISTPGVKTWRVVVGGTTSTLRPLLLLHRSSGQFDLLVSTYSGTPAVTVAPPAGITWTQAALIDVSVGSTPASPQSSVTSGSPYNITCPASGYPLIVRITP